MSADLILVNWNGREDTLRALDAVMPQVRRRSDVRVTVVDNGSTDGSLAAITASHPTVQLIGLASNHGFTGGIRAGVDVASADFLIFLNNDTVVEDGWLDRLIEAIESAPSDVAAVGGRMTDADGMRVDFIGGVMTFDGHAFQNGFRKPLGEVAEPARHAELLFACGGNMIVRREVYLALGGFDHDYFAYLEDVDFGWRSWIAGHRVIYEPLALARHKSSATSDRLGAFERGVLFERNALQTVVKNFGEERFGAALAPVLLTLLHRLHRYTTERNPGAEQLRRAPLGESAPPPRKGRLARLFRPTAPPIVTDPLSVMQFRAIHWFFENSEKLMAKRSLVQAMRRRDDAEIFERFPLHYVPTYYGDDSLFGSSLFRALRVGLPSTERRLDDIIQP